ncbi:MAG: DUF2461 domain-containing protein [Chitinophagaceae bacterium]
MLQPTTIKFLRDLKENNHREWFEKNRKVYEAAKTDFAEFTGNVLQQLAKTDTSIAHLQPKDCLFRINRDVRFSKDKSPYKTNFGMGISKGGKKGTDAGYYFHGEPGRVFAGGGLWMPMAPELKKVRQEIDYCWNEFKGIISAKKFKTMYGDLTKTSEYSLTRPPKGYDENNPAIEYLKLKGFVGMASITDETLLSKDLVKKVVAAFEALRPLLDFLNRAIES